MIIETYATFFLIVFFGSIAKNSEVYYIVYECANKPYILYLIIGLGVMTAHFRLENNMTWLSGSIQLLFGYLTTLLIPMILLTTPLSLLGCIIMFILIHKTDSSVDNVNQVCH